MKLSPTTIRIICGSLSVMRVGEVDVAGGLAADVGGHVLALDRLRDHVSRSRLTVSSVSGSDGAVVGIAVNTAAVPFLSTVAGDTDLMPGSFSIAFSRSVRRVSVAGDSASCFCCASCCDCD